MSGKTEQKVLVEAFLTLRSADEVGRFLRDLLTAGEIEEFGKRLRTAQLLTEKVPYSAIEAETGLSSTTIARGARWLDRGRGGDGLVVQRGTEKRYKKAAGSKRPAWIFSHPAASPSRKAAGPSR